MNHENEAQPWKPLKIHENGILPKKTWKSTFLTKQFQIFAPAAGNFHWKLIRNFFTPFRVVLICLIVFNIVWKKSWSHTMYLYSFLTKYKAKFTIKLDGWSLKHLQHGDHRLWQTWKNQGKVISGKIRENHLTLENEHFASYMPEFSPAAGNYWVLSKWLRFLTLLNVFI